MFSFLSKQPSEKIWLFNSADEFSGNPKWLFIYINRFRKDIYACYICNSKRTVRLIRRAGMRACLFRSSFGKRLMKRAGVYVVEQCKENYPPEIQHAKILNLWHGVGLKQIERGCTRESLSAIMAKKYVRYNALYRRNMCFLVTSPFMEQHFRSMLDLREEQIIRGGYPRCEVQKQYAFHSYPHDILKKKGLPADTKIAVYAPTFRESAAGNFLQISLPDIGALDAALEEQNTLLIIKLHPRISIHAYYPVFKQLLRQVRHIHLWDNRHDIYEIFGRVELAIVDYSSIYYDFLMAGVPRFIRYVYDLEAERSTMIYDYETHTHGTLCRSFEELLSALRSWRTEVHPADEQMRRKMLDLFMAYSTEDTCESIIRQTLAYEPANIKMPTLYSFDIFDTLLTRHALLPIGVFLKVQDLIRRAPADFPAVFSFDYAEIRRQSEACAREYMRKHVGAFEISFRLIFDHMQAAYGLSEAQVEQLMQWECEAELSEVIPCEGRIRQAEDLLRKGEQVVLISDMYLPLEHIRQMVAKVSPALAQTQIFLSSETRAQKTTTLLYQQVYRAFAPWPFQAWVHYGDNAGADGRQAAKMGIRPRLHKMPGMKPAAREFIEQYKTYDACLIGAMLSRKTAGLTASQACVFNHISGLLVPYIAWVVRDARRRGYRTLYFIARDGYFLYKIAQEFVRVQQLDIKLKYIYGSRRAWRIPSFIDRVDDEFFSYFGQFSGVRTYQDLLAAACLEHEEFQSLFPGAAQPGKRIRDKQLQHLREVLGSSAAYRELLLQKAATLREPVIRYLRQEINFEEPFALVDIWGRGYTQACLGRLLDAAADREVQNVFYYSRSIVPTEGRNIRHNFTTNNSSLIIAEAALSQLPYGTTLGYCEKWGKMHPVTLDNASCNIAFFHAMEEMLAAFVREFYALPLQDAETAERMYATWSFARLAKHADAESLLPIARLRYSEAMHGSAGEFAPPLSLKMLRQIAGRRPLTGLTRSLPMSLARAPRLLRLLYRIMAEEPPAAGAGARFCRRLVRSLFKRL